LPGGVGLHTSTSGAAVSRSEDGASECRYGTLLMFIHLNWG